MIKFISSYINILFIYQSDSYYILCPKININMHTVVHLTNKNIWIKNNKWFTYDFESSNSI